MMISIHFEEERIYYLSTSGQGIIVYLIFTSLRMLMIFITLWLTSCLQAIWLLKANLIQSYGRCTLSTCPCHNQKHKQHKFKSLLVIMLEDQPPPVLGF